MTALLIGSRTGLLRLVWTFCATCATAASVLDTGRSSPGPELKPLLASMTAQLHLETQLCMFELCWTLGLRVLAAQSGKALIPAEFAWLPVRLNLPAPGARRSAHQAILRCSCDLLPASVTKCARRRSAGGTLCCALPHRFQPTCASLPRTPRRRIPVRALSVWSQGTCH
jgi:hypothetical protein